MSEPPAKVEPPPFPNHLREVREKQRLLTRERLQLTCAQLRDQDPVQYQSVSLTAIRNLEKGISKPRLSTARTLCRALDIPLEALFPLGLDDPTKNPTGKTRAPGLK
jgi:transcriptional regulator with XRE-family HTH domain